MRVRPISLFVIDFESSADVNALDNVPKNTESGSANSNLQVQKYPYADIFVCSAFTRSPWKQVRDEACADIMERIFPMR